MCFCDKTREIFPVYAIKVYRGSIYIGLPTLEDGSGSSVGIATDYGDRIPVWRDFPPVHTGPGAHPAYCTMGTGSFPEVK